jgi:hypothetical protein
MACNCQLHCLYYVCTVARHQDRLLKVMRLYPVLPFTGRRMVYQKTNQRGLTFAGPSFSSGACCLGCFCFFEEGGVLADFLKPRNRIVLGVLVDLMLPDGLAIDFPAEDIIGLC